MSNQYVTILGSNSAISVFDRYPSGQVVTIENNHILIDCGEGTQFRMQQFGVRKSKINTILITHLHGDHVFGLPGLLTSYQLAGRKEPLKIYGPAPIQEYLDINLGGTGHFIDYPLEIIELDFELIQEQKLLQIDNLKHCEVFAFELVHRIPCAGFLIRAKAKAPNMNPAFLEKYKPNVQAIKEIKQGEDFITDDGIIIPHSACTVPSDIPSSYAYCSDTLYQAELAETLKGTSTIYHESTYLHNLLEKAEARYHSTAKQAAEFAKLAEAKQLILGHYSSRYKDISVFLDEARPIFEETELAIEGKLIDI